jgi:hypothetical protein
VNSFSRRLFLRVRAQSLDFARRGIKPNGLLRHLVTAAARRSGRTRARGEPQLIARRRCWNPSGHIAFCSLSVCNERVSPMTMVAYRVAPRREKWLVTRDGEPGMSYISQEAAYEVAVAEAAGDLRTGHEVRIEVVGDAYDRAGHGSDSSAAENPAQE